MTDEGISLWLPVLLILIILVVLIKISLHAFFGKAATAEFMGRLMYDVFMLPFRCISYLFGRRRGGRLI